MGKWTLLITDDREGIRNLLKEVLEASGYVVYTACNGQEALNRVKETKIDLVFLDLKMSGMDGLETLRLLKKTTPTTIVIIMTAYEDGTVLKDALRLGASCCISKPFDLDELKTVLKRELQKNTAASI